MPFGDLEEDEAPESSSAFDFLMQERARQKAAAVVTVSLRDPERPEFELICEKPTDMGRQLAAEARAEKAAKVKGAPAEPVIIACMTIKEWCREIRYRGKVLVANDGNGGAAFASPTLREKMGTDGAPPWMTVRELFRTNGDRYDDTTILRLMSALQRSAGLNRLDSVVVGDEPDPT